MYIPPKEEIVDKSSAPNKNETSSEAAKNDTSTVNETATE